MPTIHIDLFGGRTHEQKAALAAEITRACVKVLGGSADSVDSVDLLFYDIAKQNWATGGTLWSDQTATPSAALS